jgi:hypothetical protein
MRMAKVIMLSSAMAVVLGLAIVGFGYGVYFLIR